MSLYTIIGLMSGTSMDGLDVVLVNYEFDKSGNCSHSVKNYETYPYPHPLSEQLNTATKLAVPELLELDKKLGKHFSECILKFMNDNQIPPNTVDAIASHGHTVFHQPQKGYTLQIGCGETIAYNTGIKVINDFRQKDVVAGGEGAPLVPIGDKILYSKYADAFLNIGGFCNISIPGELTVAFDIAPGNLPLNAIAQTLGQSFDTDGIIASSGTTNDTVYNELNELSFYHMSPPKSLGTEWLTGYFDPIRKKISDPADQMRTVVEHISFQIAHICNTYNLKKVYTTGGGAFNKFLLERIQEKCTTELIVPDSVNIDYKEAIIFGLLGALYLEGKTNTLCSVTGADRDVTGGVLHLP